MSDAISEVDGCAHRAEWWMDDDNGSPNRRNATLLLCGPHRAVVLVQRAHTAIVELKPEERERFDELCEAWARESAEGVGDVSAIHR